MQPSAIEGFRLSPQQARLWSAQQADSGLAYRAEGVILIEGDLDGTALRTALADVLGRHEILRTTFRLLPGMRLPLQVISAAGAPLVREYDLSAADPEQQQAEIETLRREAGQVRFDLEHGPLIHLALARLSTTRHLLLLAAPSLCADAGTVPNLARDISRCYASHSMGDDHSDEPLQYADCAEWLNEFQGATDGAMARGKAYWRGHNLQAISVSRLPSPVHSMPGGSFSVGCLPLNLPGELTRAVAASAADCESSVSWFLLACWQVLLARLSGQTHVVVGWVHDGRGQEEFQSALGLFAKHLPLRCDLPEDLKFRALLDRVGESSRGADEWQDAFSWEDVVEQPGSLSRPVFIPICFEFEQPVEPPSADGVTFSLIEHQACVERFEVKLRGVLRGSLLTLELQYDAQVFSEDEMRYLGERLQTVLADAVRRPDATIGDLEILGGAERHRLLFDFSGTNGEELRRGTVHRLFEEQAALTPARVALVCGDRRLTYAELNARANRLAQHLRSCGVGPEVLVGLYLTRSLDVAVAILGVLKAGGAWLPLDPSYPKDRLAFLLDDAKVPVLVTHQQLVPELPKQEARLVVLDTDWPGISPNGVDDEGKGADRSNLAYLVYTSGSTGVPKGVMVTHASLCDYVQAIGKPLGVTADDVYLHTASFGFSSSVRQLLVPLAHGARVVIATTDEIREPVRLFQTVRSEGVTIIDLVPSYWRACTDTLGGLPPVTRQALLANQLRLVLSASEPLLSDLPKTWGLLLEQEAELINMFGLTETTGIVALHRIPASHEADARVVPIGRPLGNTRLYLLDARLRPVPIGVIGEIHVAGPGVSRGYLNRPALTAEAYVPDPFGNEPGARMCRTGDIGRYMADGAIEFVAREDQQLKIRGFRVEPGEIESILRGHPGVEAAVVVGQEAAPGERRVVAYIVPRAPAPSVGELQQHVKERLPAYMVPSAFVLLDALPLTPTGKLDRLALPRPDSGLADRLEAPVSPRTPTEEVLAGIWAEVLGVERLGVHDDFFALGGHSLIVTQAVSRIRRALAVEVPFEAVFDAPTVAELGVVVDRFVTHGGTS